LPPGMDAWLVTRSNDVLDRARLCAQRAKSFRAQGRHILADMQLERSSQLLQVALAVYPMNLSARYLIIGCLMQMGEDQEAKDHAVAALRDCEQQGKLLDPALHLAVAHTSVKLGQAGDAACALQDAVRDFPRHPGPAAMLAKVLCSMGRCSDGRGAAELALERDSAVVGRNSALTAAERSDVRKVLENQAPDTAVGELSIDGGVASIGSGPLRVSEEAARRVLELGHPGPTASQNSQPVRCKPFGRQVKSPRMEKNVLREAALSDLERVFSNLMPSNAALSPSERRGPDVQMGCSNTLCCRKSTIVDI